MTDGLVVENTTILRGGLTICRDVSLVAPAGEVTVLLGANGAGKSTLLDGISGVLRVSSGEISVRETRIESLPRYKRARAGISYVEQDRTVFAQLSVAENISVVDPSDEARLNAVQMFPRLEDKLSTPAGLLSGGEQQMLLLARALAMRPRVLIIDELSLGLAPNIVRDLMETLGVLAASGIAILLVEQFAELALNIGTSAYVMERGKIVKSSSCAAMLSNIHELEATYLSGVTGTSTTENREGEADEK